MPGQHTREVCRDVLELDDERVDQLIADGVLFSAAERVPTGS